MGNYLTQKSKGNSFSVVVDGFWNGSLGCSRFCTQQMKLSLPAFLAIVLCASAMWGVIAAYIAPQFAYSDSAIFSSRTLMGNNNEGSFHTHTNHATTSDLIGTYSQCNENESNTQSGTSHCFPIGARMCLVQCYVW
jgi:hypothetical protein